MTSRQGKRVTKEKLYLFAVLNRRKLRMTSRRTKPSRILGRELENPIKSGYTTFVDETCLLYDKVVDFLRRTNPDSYCVVTPSRESRSQRRDEPLSLSRRCASTRDLS